GIELISLASGCDAVERELGLGSKAEPMLVFGAWDQPQSPAPPRQERPAEFPLLVGARREQRGGTIEVYRTFDPAQDVFLNDHRLDGVPVLPFAMATELIAEAAQSSWPDLQLYAIRDMQLLKGVTLENGPRTLKVSLRVNADAPVEHAGA